MALRHHQPSFFPEDHLPDKRSRPSIHRMVALQERIVHALPDEVLRIVIDLKLMTETEMRQEMMRARGLDRDADEFLKAYSTTIREELLQCVNMVIEGGEQNMKNAWYLNRVMARKCFRTLLDALRKSDKLDNY